MSIYNLMYGLNPITLFIIPILFEKHIDELPRFRDCFVEKEGNDLVLSVLDRTGLPNRHDYDVTIYTENPDFIDIREKLVKKDFTDDTYAYYRFKIPEKWRVDFLLCVGAIPHKTSDSFQQLIRKIWPKLEQPLNVIFEKK